MNDEQFSQILRKSQILIAIALSIFVVINIIYLFNDIAIDRPATTKIIAYDIDKQIDRQRKEQTQKQYGEKVGEIVDDAIKNNEESSNSQYKIERKDPLNKKAEKFVRQIKDRGLIDVGQDYNS
jgi:hypothetical protein